MERKKRKKKKKEKVSENVRKKMNYANIEMRTEGKKREKKNKI